MKTFPRKQTAHQKYRNSVRFHRFELMQKGLSAAVLGSYGVSANRIMKVMQEPVVLSDITIFVSAFIFGSVASGVIWWYILPTKEKYR